MTARVKRLRDISIRTEPSITIERASLITKFCRDLDRGNTSAPVRRALAFQYIMENKSIYIGKDELIVGERGPAPRATPTYPEICCHGLKELDILHSRKKVSYSVGEPARKIYKEEIIPYWSGRTIRERIFGEMDEEWMLAYEAGIFTEFMEQRAPGHTVLDDKIYTKGLGGLKEEIRDRLNRLDFLNDPEAFGKKEELKAMDMAASAVIAYAGRHAEKASKLAKKTSNLKRKKELERIAEVCSRVPEHPPRNFREALQAYWFVHVSVITELNTWDAISPGRLDQHLYPFFKKDTEEGELSAEEAKELLSCFWIKFNNQPAPPKVGVTAEESGTYNDFALISLGGVKKDGSDGVNPLSYMILEVLEEMKLVQPHCCVQVSQKSPEQFVRRAVEINRTGIGQPSVFNHDAVVMELVRQGKTIEDARNGGTSGCVETGAFGKENYNLTGYFNMMKVLEITLNNGTDPRSGKKIGLETGDPRHFRSFDDLFAAYEKQLRHFVDIKIRGNQIIERIYASNMPTPFLSLLISDCIEKGRDYHDGGARYNTSYIQGVGMGSITDSMAALCFHVFDKKTFTMEQVLNGLKHDFQDQEAMRQTLRNRTPRYGNDDSYADDIMKRLFEAYFQAIDGRENTRGGHYCINLLPTTSHVYFGSVLGASADGRKAGLPLSEGVSPVQGADRKGPTAVIKSVSKIDHLRTGGTLLNQKFTPHLLEGEEGIDKLSHLIRSYFRLNGHHIQFNVVRAETLREAQKNPEQYRNLIVRVAGYSDYFCNLSKPLQDEIIARTEHLSF